MLIFLSVSMMETVVTELCKGGYDRDTAVAIVEKATWDDESILHGTLADIAEKVKMPVLKKLH